VHIDNYAARLEYGRDCRTTTPSVVDGPAHNAQADVGESVLATSGEECEVPEYMIAPARSSPVYRTLPGGFPRRLISRYVTTTGITLSALR
jgi:hypothetical protein